LYFTY